MFPARDEWSLEAVKAAAKALIDTVPEKHRKAALSLSLDPALSTKHIRRYTN